LLTDSLSTLLPAFVGVGQDKMGFSFPFCVWLGRELRPFVEEILSPYYGVKTPLLELGNVQRIGLAHMEQYNRWAQTWALVVLKMWLRLNVRGCSD